LFFQLNDGTSTVKTLYFPDVITTQLPLTYNDNTTFSITLLNLNSQYSIALYDYNQLLSNTLMASYYWTPNTAMPTNGDLYPTVLSFGSSTDKLRFDLNIEWK
jgi:hypothetical protein